MHEEYETNPFVISSSRELERTLLKINGLMTEQYPIAADSDDPKLPGIKRNFIAPDTFSNRSKMRRGALANLALAPLFLTVVAILWVPWNGIIFVAPSLAVSAVAFSAT